MRVVLDTNVLVSSTLIEQGKPFKILKKAESGKIELFISPEIIQELEDVLLQDKIPFEKENVKEFVEKIISISTVVIPKEDFQVINKDPEDNKILECAIEAGTNYIISGDPHLLDLKNFKGIKILSPDEFLKALRS